MGGEIKTTKTERVLPSTVQSPKMTIIASAGPNQSLELHPDPNTSLSPRAIFCSSWHISKELDQDRSTGIVTALIRRHCKALCYDASLFWLILKWTSIIMLVEILHSAQFFFMGM